MVQASIKAIIFWVVFIAVCILILTSRSVFEIAVVIAAGIVFVLIDESVREKNNRNRNH